MPLRQHSCPGSAHQRRIVRQQSAKSIEVVSLNAVHRSFETGVGRLCGKGDSAQGYRNGRQSKKPHVDLSLGVGEVYDSVRLNFRSERHLMMDFNRLLEDLDAALYAHWNWRVFAFVAEALKR